MRKKILFIVEAMGGGIFTYIVDLSNELVKKYDMYIAYSTRPQTPLNYEKYFDSRIHLIKVSSFTRSINPIKDIKATIEVKRLSKKINPDVIHLHSSKAGVIGRFSFNGKKIPLFYTPHGYSFLMANYNPIKRAIFRTIEKLFAKRKCMTISCSFGEHLETLKLTSNADYINNGINTVELNKLLNEITIKDHQFVVFTLGRICHQKNPKLFNSIAEALPNINFIWIGDGELKSELKSPNIEVTGWVSREEALQLSKNTDVFLLTSLWEGLPISLLEAMYMRKLCVVSDVIGNHDVIHNGVNGFVCQSVSEFKDAINCNDSTNLIENAYKEILEQYNTSIMAQKYINIFESAIRSKNK